MFQEALNSLPFEIFIVEKEKNILFSNKKALENFGATPVLSEVKEILNKKGRKAETAEINLGENKKLIVFFDITERESLKEAYQVALSYLSHEFKTPFAIASGYLENLELYLEKKASFEKIIDCFKKVKTAFQRLEKLLKKLFSGLDYLAKEIKTKTEPVYLKEIIEEAIFWVNPLAEEKKVVLDVNVKEELWTKGSADLLTQALFNILENAIKASPEKGKVKISAYPFGNKKILISVKDQGPGVEPEKLSLLGMPFLKLKKTDGMGLGLFITKRIIEAHGGEIKFKLPPEGGLEVQIILKECPGPDSNRHGGFTSSGF